MKIRHRIAYNKEKVSKAFLDFLIENNAKFELAGGYIGVAYILEEEDYLDELLQYYQLERTTPLIDVVYTESEYRHAEWLSIHPRFRFEYPQPEDQSAYVHHTYNNKNYCEKCGCGLIQKTSFRVNEEPQWGKRHFLMLNWIEDELFVSSIAKECISSNEIIGLKWFDVINHRKNIAFEDFHQIYVENELEVGMTNLQQSVKQVIKCKVCGNEKYIYSGRGLTFRKEVLNKQNIDIIKSHESFGSGLMCAKIIIVSQKLYRLLKDNGLDKGISFEPITLI